MTAMEDEGSLALAAARNGSTGEQGNNFSRTSSGSGGADVSIGLAVTLPMDVSKINSAKEVQIKVLIRGGTVRGGAVYCRWKRVDNSDLRAHSPSRVPSIRKLAVSAMAGVPVEHLELENMENAGTGSVRECSKVDASVEKISQASALLLVFPVSFLTSVLALTI